MFDHFFRINELHCWKGEPSAPHAEGSWFHLIRLSAEADGSVSSFVKDQLMQMQ